MRLRNGLLAFSALVAIASAPMASRAQDAGYYAQVTYTATGGSTYTVPFPYIQQADIQVYVNATLQAATTYSFPTTSTLTFTSAPASGASVVIKRVTSVASAAATYSGGPVASASLNVNQTQAVYGIQEARDRATALASLIASSSGGGASTALSSPIDAKSVYGIKCDGSTDDTTALQAAISSGQSLQLPAGICLFNPPLNINLAVNRAQRIQGAGETDEGNLTQGGRTILKALPASTPSATPAGIIIDGSGLANHYMIGNRLSDFTLDISGLPDLTTMVGIKVRQAFDLSFDHIRVYSNGNYAQRAWSFVNGVYGTNLWNVQGQVVEASNPGGYGGNPTTLSFVNADLFSAKLDRVASVTFTNGGIQPVWDATVNQPVNYIASGNTNMLGFYSTVAMFNAANGTTGGVYTATGASFSNMQSLLTSGMDFESGGVLPTSCALAVPGTWTGPTWNDGVNGCHPFFWVISVANTVAGCDMDSPILSGVFLSLPTTNSCDVRSFDSPGTGYVATDFLGKPLWFDSTLNLINSQAFHCWSDILVTQTCLIDASSGGFVGQAFTGKSTDGTVFFDIITTGSGGVDVPNGASIYGFSDMEGTSTFQLGTVSGQGRLYLINPTTSSNNITLSATDGAIQGGNLYLTPVGAGGAASTGAFTTLTASSTVSGVGFVNWAASPPAIGTTSPNHGYFDVVNASGLASSANVCTDGSKTLTTTCTSLSFITPSLGAATATSINKVAVTAPASGATLTLADGKTLTVNNSLTLVGTDSTVITFPTSTATMVDLTSTQTLTNKTLTAPVFTAPSLGAATATTINKVTLTAPATGSTLTISDGKTLVVSNTMTLAGTDTTSVTFPSGASTMARTDAAQTFTGAQTFSSPVFNGTMILNSASTFQLNGRKTIINTAPTYSSGFSTGTPTISGTTTLAFTVTIGTTPSSSGVLTMPSGANAGWACKVNDVTTTSITADVSATSNTSVTTTFYSRTTGTATAPTASDVIQYMCAAY